MTRHLPDGEPTLTIIAEELHMSVRSLQRRLSDEGTSFAALFDELRRDLARHHLLNPAMSIHEVAFLLGFAGVAAFHRAFKRWTGSTPAHYQRTARQTAG